MMKMSSTGGPMMMIEGDLFNMLLHKISSTCIYAIDVHDFYCSLFVPTSKSMYEREKADYRLIVNAAGTDGCRIVHLLTLKYPNNLYMLAFTLVLNFLSSLKLELETFSSKRMRLSLKTL